jgi:hypothetical protein
VKHSSTQVSASSTPNAIDGRLIYLGPLARTARFLKLFSVSSLGIAIVATPFIFLVKSGMTFEFRSALAGAALFTSMSSTALIHFCLSPYVTQITLPGESNDMPPDYVAPITTDTELTLETMTFFAKPRYTRLRVRDLMPSTRIFSSWRTIAGQELHIQPEAVQTEEMQRLIELVQSKQIE